MSLNINTNINTNMNIPGILILEGNKTYGRENKKNNARLFYKCIPNNKSLPPVLIPYEIKQMGFHKIFTNLFVLFSLNNDIVSLNKKNDSNNNKIKIERSGKLENVIGPIDILENFFEYQLYCKCLTMNKHNSIHSFQKIILKTIHDKSEEIMISEIREKWPQIEDRIADHMVFSIDPHNCTDFDDAFSICEIYPRIYKLSIYISNVSIWLDYFEAWDYITERISTIYLPNKKHPMLPNVLSDNLCSLKQGVVRPAFTMDLFIDSHMHEIIDIKYTNSFIKVYKNYCYEERKLLTDINYISLNRILNDLLRETNQSQVQDSHELVAQLMIFMNYYSSKELIQHNIGIFRKIESKNRENIENRESLQKENLESLQKENNKNREKQEIYLYKNIYGTYIDA
jgi:hypothetical protein